MYLIRDKTSAIDFFILFLLFSLVLMETSTLFIDTQNHPDHLYIIASVEIFITLAILVYSAIHLFSTNRISLFKDCGH